MSKNVIAARDVSTFILLPPKALKNQSSPLPFIWWGIDILGPFPKAAGQVKFLVVAIDYFTKGIEAQALATITAKNMEILSSDKFSTGLGFRM